MTDLPAVDLDAVRERPPPRMVELDDGGEPEGREEVVDRPAVVALEQRRDAAPALRRNRLERRNAQVVRVLVGDPDMRDPTPRVVRDERLRMQGPAFVEGEALEQGSIRMPTPRVSSSTLA